MKRYMLASFLALAALAISNDRVNANGFCVYGFRAVTNPGSSAAFFNPYTYGAPPVHIPNSTYYLGYGYNSTMLPAYATMQPGFSFGGGYDCYGYSMDAMNMGTMDMGTVYMSE